MRILVAGAEGFLGRWLAADLRAAGHDVVGVDRAAASPGTIAHDLRNRPALGLGRLDAIVHLASAAGGFLRNAAVESIVADERAMLDGLAALSDGSPGARMVYASSIAVFEASGVGAEDALARRDQRTPYARAKAWAEAEVAARWKNFAIVRPTNFFGPDQPRHGDRPGESHVIPDLLAKIRGADADVEVLGDGAQVRNFVHLRDVAWVFARLVESAAAPRYAHVRSDLFLSIAELARELIGFAGVAKRIRYRPEYLAYEPAPVGAFPMEAAGRLGYAPRVRSLAEGLCTARSAIQPMAASSSASQGAAGAAGRSGRTAQPPP